MVTYKTIVVPTDGSENAKRALEHALCCSGSQPKAELIVVHVANIVSAISNLIKHQFLVDMYLSKLLRIWKKLVRKFLMM